MRSSQIHISTSCAHKGAMEMNSDMNDVKRSAALDSVPAALLDVHQRLLEDGAAWRDELPLGATQALHETAVTQYGERPANDQSGPMPVMAQPPNMPRREVSWGRRLIASAAIVVVVGLLAALFASFARGRIDTHLTSGGYNPSPIAATPASTPGPAAKYIVNVVTARSVDNNF